MTFSRPARLAPLSILLCMSTLFDAAGQTPPEAGSRVVDYVAELRANGINVIYSDDLLTVQMRVQEPPAGSTPLEHLRNTLEPLGLALRPGPRGSWLVVRAPAEVPRSAATPPRPGFAPSPPALENVIVTASRYAFSRSTSPSTRQLQRAQLENLPVLGDDALRATHGLPGVTSSGLSARFNIRGGETDESLMLIDGVRLYNPFHLKEFQSLFSSISPRILDSVEVRTGGYPAEFGDRMSAVVDMRTVIPTEARHHEVAVSTLSSSVLSSGRFAEDRGEWLTSLRRGNLDLLVDAAGSDIGQPQYTDFFTKLSFALDSRWRVVGGALMLNDKISLRDEPFAAAGDDYDDSYFWLRFDHEPGTGFAASYLLSRSALESSRNGSIDDPSRATGSLSDHRTFVSTAMKADWSFELSDRSVFRWGMELEDTRADYDVSSSAVFHAPIMFDGVARTEAAVDAELDVDRRHHAAYAAYRIRPIERFTAELGLRWDRQSYPEDTQTSPRLHFMLDVGSRSTVRASWGRYFQAQGLNELQLSDGIDTFYPAQEAEHLVIGFERLLGESASLRIEAYRKEFDPLRPRFENLFSRTSLLPELLPDRVAIEPLRGEARGIEVALDGEKGSWGWWVSVARADVRDVLASGRRRRSWDEPWSVKGGIAWSSSRWTVTGAMTAHAGWPVTGLSVGDGRLVAADLNEGRFETFASLDVKATRRLALERLDMSWFVEITNLLGRDNACCVDYAVEFDSAGLPARLETEYDEWLPTVPSIGFLLEF